MTRRPRSATACLGLALVAASCEYDVQLVRAPAPAPDVAVPAAPRWAEVASGTAQDLHAVWGTSSSDVWAVGDMGTAIHWDGASWRVVPTGTPAQLNGVWASRPDDAWAVGATFDDRPVLLRWDGARWNPVRLPAMFRVALRAVWGDSARDVWAVGASPDTPEAVVWHWNGSDWRPEFVMGMRQPTLSAVSGGGPGDMWTVGAGPTMLHWTMGSLRLAPMPPRSILFGGALCVGGDGSVWATGVTGAVHRLSGASWSAFTVPSMTTVRGLWCGPGDEVWGAGDGGRVARWNGSAWTSEAVARANLAAVWGIGGERWAVGSRGTVLRYGP